MARRFARGGRYARRRIAPGTRARDVSDRSDLSDWGAGSRSGARLRVSAPRFSRGTRAANYRSRSFATDNRKPGTGNPKLLRKVRGINGKLSAHVLSRPITENRKLLRKVRGTNGKLSARALSRPITENRKLLRKVRGTNGKLSARALSRPSNPLTGNP